MKKFYLYAPKIKNNFFNSKACAILPEIKNKKIIAISAHADDLSIACGGTLALLSPTNKITPILFFTGHRGVTNSTQNNAIQTRETEMTRETEILKIAPPIFLRLASYEHDDNKTIMRDITLIAHELEKQNPEIIFLPWQRDSQPRHRLASIMSLAALKKTNLKPTLFFYETTWQQFGALDFNTGFVLDQQIMATKLAAIRAHQSQLQRTAFDHAAKILAQLRAITVPEQRMYGYGQKTKHAQIKYLEVFLKKNVR